MANQDEGATQQALPTQQVHHDYRCPKSGHGLYQIRGIAQCVWCGTVSFCKDGVATDISADPAALMDAVRELMTAERILSGERDGLKLVMQRWVEAQRTIHEIVAEFTKPPEF